MSTRGREERVIRTVRLTLRPYERGDVDDVLVYATDPDWKRYLPGIPEPYRRRDAQDFVDRCRRADWVTLAEFAIEHEGRIVGGVSARIEPEEGAAELGYALAPSLWGRGLVTEAAAAVADWLFEARGLVRVFARADARNSGSRRVMEKLGMQHEGTLRSHRIARDGRQDEVWYGVLREEWAGPDG